MVVPSVVVTGDRLARLRPRGATLQRPTAWPLQWAVHGNMSPGLPLLKSISQAFSLFIWLKDAIEEYSTLLS